MAATEQGRHVLFDLGGETYAVPVAAVREVVDAPAITPVPRTHPCIEGIVNLRGNVVPVVHLGRRLGLPPGEQPRCIVMVEWQGELVGLLVDQVTAVRSLGEVQTEGVRGTGAAADPYLLGVARLEGERLAVVLDLDRLLDLKER